MTAPACLNAALFGSTIIPVEVKAFSAYPFPADTSTYTATNVPIGAYTADRIIVLGVSCQNNGGGTEPLTCTVGGVSASRVAFADGGGASTVATIYMASNVPGTTANIVIEMNSAVNSAGLMVWSLDRLSPTVIGTVQSTTQSGTIDVPGGGIIVAYASHRSTTNTWTGLTVDIDQTIESTKGHSGASLINIDAWQKTINFSISASSNDALVAISLGPKLT